MNTTILRPFTIVLTLMGVGLTISQTVAAEPIAESFARALGEYDSDRTRVGKEQAEDPVLTSFQRLLEHEAGPRAPVIGVGVDHDDLYLRISPVLWTRDSGYDSRASGPRRAAH